MQLARVFRIFVGLATIAGLAVQYFLQVADSPRGLVDATVQYFSYFTILGNLVGVAVMLAPAIAPTSLVGRFSLRPDVRTATTLYLLQIGFVYHMILTAQLAPASGLGLFSDYIIHTLVPVAFAIDWILLVDKRGLTLRMTPSWIVFPAVYGAYVLIRGALTGVYPYWFLQVDKLGAVTVTRNFILLLAAFLIGGAGLVFLGRAFDARFRNSTPGKVSSVLRSLFGRSRS
ncbi:MAG: Pr6Pr family membrane protein [Parvularculaceae bacterium]|nr:Pr6Pr family membrane protein [Parvularculaceae bacterium]